MFSWDFDAPTGTYKNHQLSNRLLFNALENSVMMPFVDTQEDFGKRMGESTTITRFTHITEVADATLSELSPIPEVAFDLTTHAVTVTENGVAVPFTGKLEALSKFDMESAIQRTLSDQMRLVLDSRGYTAAKATNVKYVPTSSTAGNFDFDGSATGVAVEDLAYFHIEDVSQTMFDSLLIPHHSNDQYIGILRHKTLQTLRRDAQFLSWNQFSSPEKKAKGETGTIEQIRLISTNHQSAGALPNAGANNFGEGIVFGQDAVIMVEAESPHLRAGIPTDYGRNRGIAWYGIYGFGLQFDVTGITTEAGSRGISRIVHLTST